MIISEKYTVFFSCTRGNVLWGKSRLVFSGIRTIANVPSNYQLEGKQLLCLEIAHQNQT